jgi:glycine/D-amino acid oxidase-like deaminating enzyme
MNALIPVSKIPAAVILDVLSLLKPTGRKKPKQVQANELAAAFEQFLAECMQPSRTARGVKITAIQKRFEQWLDTTAAKVRTAATCRQLAAMFRERGAETYSAHNKQTAVRGWQLK